MVRILFTCLVVCLAHNTVLPATMELYGNFHTLGVIVTIASSDDPDRDAVAIPECRLTGASYRTGFPLTRVSDTRFVGSIFYLQPGQTYEVRVSFSDSDSDPLDGVIVSGSQTTRAEIVIPAPLHSYYVSTTGLDANPGSIEEPFATLAHAAQVAQAGDEIVLRGGVYRQGEIAWPRSGSSTAPIVIRGYDDEIAIMDGSDPAVYAWTAAGGGVYRTTVSVSDVLFIAANGKRLMPYKNLTDLQNLKWGIPGSFTDGTTIYVRLADMQDPNLATMILSRYNHALLIEARNYVCVQDITFRFYGSGGTPKAVYLNNADYCLIKNCTFAMNNIGVGIKRNSDRNVIEDNEFYDDVYDWPWEYFYDDSPLSIGNITTFDPVTGRGTVIRNNVFHDCFDGFSACPESETTTTNETDVYGNTMYRCGDDGMEADGMASNVRIWDNTIHEVLVGISVAPVYVGPIYLLRNLIYRTGEGSNSYEGTPFKFNSGYSRSGVIYIFHNTCDVAESGNHGLHIKQPGEWEMIYARNNIWSGTSYALYDYNISQPIDFDYNGYWTPAVGTLVRWYPAIYTDLLSFTAATGHEVHGVHAQPGFANPAAGDYGLLNSSAMLNKGEYIPGINDGYSGSAPELGAFEYQETATCSLFLKLYLQGPYVGPEMRVNPALPGTPPADCVDSLQVQLYMADRSSLAGYYDLYLRQDGQVMDKNGNTAIALTGLTTGVYYISVATRNHLKIISSAMLSFTPGTVVSYDFSTNPDRYFGAHSAVEVSTGVWASVAGDINQDGYVTTSDYVLWFNTARTTPTGYQDADLNADALIDLDDYVLILSNAQSGARTGF